MTSEIDDAREQLVAPQAQGSLNDEARLVLQFAGITPQQWADYHFLGPWLGDECGCSDDRCIGFHHDDTRECGCLPVLIERYFEENHDAAGPDPRHAR